ncbi:hypothetical protein Hanom_Chr05g00389411 [Helianthus anomalus]
MQYVRDHFTNDENAKALFTRRIYHRTQPSPRRSRHLSIDSHFRSIGRQRHPIEQHNCQIHHLLTTTGMPSAVGLYQVRFMILRKLILIQKL